MERIVPWPFSFYALRSSLGHLLSNFFYFIQAHYLLRYWTKQANSWYVARFAMNCQVDEMNDVSLSEKICQK